MKARHAYLTMFLIAALSSCSTVLEDMKMTDHSFEFRPSVVYDQDKARNCLVLNLEKGQRKDFKGTFNFGDAPSTVLL